MSRHLVNSRLPLALLGAVATLAAALGGPTMPLAAERFNTIAAVEPKGGTTVDKEPFPTTALPEGGGYELKAPNAEGRWEVSTYRWDPNQILVNEGDDVTLQFIGINGAEHPTSIEGFDLTFVIKRGEVTTITFKADRPGVFRFICGTHVASMVGELIVLAR